MKTVVKIQILFAILFLFCIKFVAAETNPQTQTVRGRVLDQDTKQPLIGASVIILHTDPFIAAITDEDGYYTLESVPLGRITVEVSYLGYEPKVLPNVVVGSAKQVLLNFELVESVIKVDEVVISAQSNVKKDEALNQMALVSAKMFTVEETGRYAGSFNDPARLVSGFAGVTGDAEGDNDIVVRGNSPKGILWRLEGIEIPNPNHFANEGGTGGPINALNSQMLDNSDFFSGAFTSEYGNAFSGVFDMRLRTGNNQEYENTFSLGVFGTDITMEGPFSKDYKGSYLVNYRYSSLDLLDKAGIVNFYGVPKYQDGSFKLNLPTEKIGRFSVFGLYGKSNIFQFIEDEDQTRNVEEADFGANLHVYGITNTYLIGKSSYIKNTISYQSTKNDLDYRIEDDNQKLYHAYDEYFKHTYIKYATCFNTKINAKNTLKIGAIYTDLGFDIENKYDLDNEGKFYVALDQNGQSGMIQSYVNWKYRYSEKVTLISGVHYLNYLINDDYSIEPRLALKYTINPKQNITLGGGIHTKTESLSIYYIQLQDTTTGEYYKPNENLEMGRAAHIVLGYGNRITENHNLKIEVYYQHLYNLAVENDPTSSLALANVSSGWEEVDFVNKGKGENYGLELTLERYYKDNFYYMVTASLYESKITALDGVERDSRYNGNFASNLILGKEWEFGKDGKSKTFDVNLKIAYLGGNYYTPLDLEKSKEEGTSKYSKDLFSKKADNVLQANFACSYIINREKTRHEFKIDIQNVINYQARVDEYYDESTGDVAYWYQLPLLPSIIYAIHF